MDELKNEKIALSAAEAAQLVGISRSLMYQWLQRADCDFAFTIGGRRLISRSRLESWIERQAAACNEGRINVR